MEEYKDINEQLYEEQEQKPEFYKIPFQNMEGLNAKIEKLNRKAVKINFPKITLNIIGESETVQKDKTVIKYHHITIEGESPVIEGYKFIATIDHLMGEGNVIRAIPNVSIPTKYREAEPACEHCKINRYRKDTYLLQKEENGDIFQIGKTCLKDFLGHSNPDNIARYAQWLADAASAAEDSLSYSGGGSKFIETESYLDYVSEMTLTYGYMSKGKAREMNEQYDTSKYVSTSEKAVYEMYPNPLDKTHVKIYPTEQAKELTQKAMQWMDTWKEEDNLNDFLYNVKTICGLSSIEYRHLGIASALIGSYLRDLDKEKEQERKDKEKGIERKPSEYMGTVGQREEFTLIVIKVIPIETDYGRSYLHIMEDLEGNSFTWFASGKSLNEEKKYKVKASVKTHEEYKGVKKTVITRAKAEEIE